MNPSKRPPTFAYKDDVAKRILQHVQNPGTKKAINKALGQLQEADIQLRNPSNFSTFDDSTFDDDDFTPITSTTLSHQNEPATTLATSKGHFSDKWLYDTASQVHVTNNDARGTNFRQVDSRLATGDSHTSFTWLCDTYVVLDTPSGPQKLHLQNVRYIPNSHINVVAPSLLWEQGFHYKERENELWLYNDRFAYLKRFLGLPVLEFLDDSHLSAATILNPSDLHDLIHKRFLHPGMPVMQHLIPNTVSTSQVCEVCNMTMALLTSRIASRDRRVPRVVSYRDHSTSKRLVLLAGTSV